MKAEEKECAFQYGKILLYEDFKTFMRDSDNKAELFLMIANSISHIKDAPTSIIVTVNEKVISNGFDIDFENIMPCNQEKAGTRLILHVFDGCRKGYKKLTIVSSDTDIVVIALYHFYDLDVNELWIEYGVGQHKRWLPIHEYGNRYCDQPVGAKGLRALFIDKIF